MTTIEERREVARRLRETGEELGSAALLWYHIAKIIGVRTATDGKTACDMLADLIEPSCDRERLLAIATLMAADSVRSVKQGISVSPVYILHAARNIAEACGETFGSIRNRELAKWGTSIVPKETIVDRDELLDLADEMEAFAETEYCAQAIYDAACNSINAFADRIREAVGA